MAQAWLVNVAGERGSGGYVTAEEALASDPPPRSKLGLVARKADPKVKRHTVASVVAEQANLVSLVANLARQVQTLVEQREAPHQVEVSTPLPHREAHHQVEVSPPMPQDQFGFAPGLQAHSGASLNPLRQALARPLSAMAPPLQATPKNLAQVLGPPPARRHAPEPFAIQENALAGTIGDVPLEDGEGKDLPLAEVMLAQSRALTALVSHLSQGGDPLVDLAAPSSVSTRGTSSRQKLQAELRQRDGAFFKKVLAAASRRMDPANSTLGPGETGSVMCKYLERYGGFGSQKEWGLVQWQLAQVMDLAAGGHWESALDHVALLMIMVEQTALDSGRTDLSWLLTLQPDPPSSIFLNHQSLPTSSLRPFAPLADQRLIASTLAYVKELDTLSTKRAELTAPKSKPGPPVPSPSGLRTSDQPVLTKKQLRAKAWAEKKAAAAAQN